jgi:hypothetical protein
MTATCVALFSATLIGCSTAAPATPRASTPVVATATPAGTPSATATAAASATPTSTASAAPSEEPTATASASPSSAPVVTIVPGSSLDPSQADSGIAGRITIPDDTRVFSDKFTGTHEVLGVAADGSDCSYSFSGDTFTANAEYDNAPVGMLYQLLVGVPADEMPSNDGEQRSGIQDGRVRADFHSSSGIGGSYSGAATDTSDPGMSTIDVVVNGDTYTFSFTGETWDHVAFSGQLICTGVTDS